MVAKDNIRRQQTVMGGWAGCGTAACCAALLVAVTACQKSTSNEDNGRGGSDAGHVTEPSSNTDSPAQTSADDRLTVYTTFYPMTFFTEFIGGEHVDVVCPVPTDADPIFWQPTDEAIEAYQQAPLIVINGAEFEKWVQTVTLPPSRIVNTAESFDDEFVTFDATTHSHGLEGDHTHEGIDGHTWLDPVNAMAQAEAILEALVDAAPAHEQDFVRRFTDLKIELTLLDESYRDLVRPLENRMLLASHPAYNYLAKRYGWNIRNFDLDPDTPLSAENLRELETLDRALDESYIMLWESEPLEETANLLASEYGVQSVLFSPCEMLSEEEQASGRDYLKVMFANVERLQEALRPATGEGG